tara:strand:- start:402 stop:719 length:318 start_codon:yes stop_codon:yes gene_type:complete
MSHFYGMIPESARKTVPTARGHKKTGLATIAAGWAGAIRVNLWYNPNEDVDCYEVEMIPWESQGDRHVIARGVLGDAKQSSVFVKQPFKHGSTSSYAQTTIALVQ